MQRVQPEELERWLMLREAGPGLQQFGTVGGAEFPSEYPRGITEAPGGETLTPPVDPKGSTDLGRALVLDSFIQAASDLLEAITQLLLSIDPEEHSNGAWHEVLEPGKAAVDQVIKAAKDLRITALWQKQKSADEIRNRRYRDSSRFKERTQRRTDAHNELGFILAPDADALADLASGTALKLPNPASAMTLWTQRDQLQELVETLEKYQDAEAIERLQFGNKWRETTEQPTPLQAERKAAGG